MIYSYLGRRLQIKLGLIDIAIPNVISNMIAEYVFNDTYGLKGCNYPGANDFRIIDNFDKIDSSNNLKRRGRPGMICRTMSIPKLIDIMYRLDIPYPDNNIQIENEKERLHIIDILLKDNKFNHNLEEIMGWDFRKLIFYAGWYTNNMLRSQMRELIQNQMDRFDIFLFSLEECYF